MHALIAGSRSNISMTEIQVLKIRNVESHHDIFHSKTRLALILSFDVVCYLHSVVKVYINAIFNKIFKNP